MNLTTIFLVAAILTSEPAQPTGESNSSARSQDSIVCLTGSVEGPDSGGRFTFVASSKRVPDLQARGFVVEQCAGKEANAARYRNEICRFAAATPVNVKRGFERRYGIGPDEMCALAEEL